MRILVVSGHFPPNFVSGGSLQPQRLARGLRARGHDVRVYAGRLDHEREALDAWDEVDPTGLPVRWIVTTPWDDWSDRRNWICPPVERDFRSVLARFRPDVVHLHDLQMLGASLVSAAAEAGARVVVTMHDYWWLCQRLFLVGRDLHPCSLVVDAGVCRCESGRRALLARKGEVGEHLAAADLVLTPSAIMARVLAANGVAADRLAVDENGLPDEELGSIRGRAVEHADTGAVRFTYAGGPNELKGSAVTVRAAAALRGADRWALAAYGLDDGFPEALGVDVEGLPIAFHPAFAPDEKDQVFAQTDVLLVPSLARESYSIITREALSRGIPVICSDTLGPEEVVRHEVNGLIVPADDPEMLAEAMRSATDLARLDRLRAGAAQPVRIRSLSEQVDELERRYQELVGAPPQRTTSRARSSVQRVAFAVGIQGAPLRYRARLAAEAIALQGVRSSVHHFQDPELLREVERADRLYVYRAPASPELLGLIERARDRGVPVLFDVDDLIFDPDVAERIPALALLPEHVVTEYMDGVRRYRTTMEHCDGYVGSTRTLVEHARALTGLPAARFDNGVGLLLGRASQRVHRRPRHDGPPRLGYFSGTITHDRDWAAIEPAVVQALGEHPEVELWLGGHLTTTPALEPFEHRTRRLPFVPWDELPALLHEVDVNLAPLEIGPVFNEAKSAIKWLEAALVGTLTIASATQPFREAIEDGVSGLLATDVDSWHAAIDRAVGDVRFRRAAGERARREALLRWSPHLQGRRFLEILDDAAAWPERARARPASGWAPVSRSEPWKPVALEPYADARLGPVGIGPLASNLAMRRSQLHWFERRARQAVAAEGAGAVARRGPRFVAARARAGFDGIRARAGHSRARELATYSRRMLAERGPAATLARAVTFGLRRARRLVLALPPVRLLLVEGRRATAALRKHGLRGTVELGAPVARHHVVHTSNVLRARTNQVRAKTSTTVRRRLSRR